jgi:pheromone shutdown protein TraB
MNSIQLLPPIEFKEILLLGTVHYDLLGQERLTRALEYEKPEILTVEASQAWLDYLKQYEQDDWKETLEVLRREGASSELVELFIARRNSKDIFYELEVSRDYASRKNIPLYMIDNITDFDATRRTIRQGFLELLSSGLLSFIRTKQNFIDVQRTMYEFAQNFFDKNQVPEQVQHNINKDRGDYIGQRDEHEALKLVELPPKKIVHVGGLMHMFSDVKNETLYSRLIDFGLIPNRRTLIWYK